MASHVWLIAAIPAAVFVITLFFGTRMPRRGAELGIGAMAVSSVLSVALAVDWLHGEKAPVEAARQWFDLGGTAVRAVTVVDGLTVVMLVLVSVISLLVQIYSTNYMRDDRRYTHYFAMMTLFTSAMLWFVMSGNVLQLIFGWELMSLCSFLLIGHWWEEKRNVHAAMKAFLTTRASDIGLFVGFTTLFFAAGRSFEVEVINRLSLEGAIDEGLLLVGAIALFVAVAGKSAQVPLHTWLPDAMAGPTPMSALIHAATMVVAGVYLVARMFPVFMEAFDIGGSAINLAAVIGALTIVLASLLAFVQHDIKKLLSYSTVSQLGFMVMALGVGAWTAAVFHLLTHAVAKALLFLCAGNISHAVHGFDMERDMGGLRKSMPVTHWSFVIGATSLAGVVPLAGFWSKEQIVAQAGSNGYLFFQAMALLGTFLTAAYLLRCYAIVFMHEHRGSGRPHEAPRVLTVPCVVLAASCVGLGFMHAPLLGLDPFGEWVTPAYVPVTVSTLESALPLLIELALTAAGIGLALVALRLGLGPRGLADRFSSAKAVYHVLYNRLYLDWLYEVIFVHGIRRGLSWLVHWVDHNVVDSFVDLTGKSAVSVGRFVDGVIDRRIVDAAVNQTANTTDNAGRAISAVQGGLVQRYVAMMLGSVVLLSLLIAVVGR